MAIPQGAHIGIPGFSPSVTRHACACWVSSRLTLSKREHEQVWADLVLLGPRLREEYLADAPAAHALAYGNYNGD
jgi:hypothetical protein